MMRAALVLSTLTPSFAVYQLKFLSDFQEGAFDTDAAEHLAYDVGSQRAFIASAESANVNVVSLSDPTAPSQTSTLTVGSDLDYRCPEVDCQYESMDFGGAGSPCGYAPTHRIVADRSEFSCCGWFGGEIETDSTMTSASACQRLCADDPECSYWSFENECEEAEDGTCKEDAATGMQVRNNECFLKTGYSLSSAQAAGFESTLECVNYVPWVAGPIYDQHAYDKAWTGAAGPAECGMIKAESVQSVATVTVDGYPNGVVVAAAPAVYEWAAGYLAFYDAKTLGYIGCAEAGIKPEGITSDSEGGLVACINEGSAREDGMMDHEGSMTMCEMKVSQSPTRVEPECTTYPFSEDHFASGAFKSAQEFRYRDVRLFGPNGDDVALDLEPEHGAFIDASTFMVSMQDNNAYAFFDIRSKKYTYLGGYGYLAGMALDPSDKDGHMHIASSFGSDRVPVHGMFMPDQVAHLEINGKHYILTANEGDTRDGEDLIGTAEAVDGTEFEGEEIRIGDLGSPSVMTCNDCTSDEILGRLLTTVYQPSDYAVNACGGDDCSAEEISKGLDPSTFKCLYKGMDYGGGGVCGYAASTTYVVDNAAYEVPGWFGGEKVVDPTMISAAACQAKCAAAGQSKCQYWSYEFEEGFHECLFKLAFAEPRCNEYSRWWQHWDDLAWQGYSGPAVCPWPRAPSSSFKGTAGTGSDGGTYAVGTRSFTIFEFTSPTAPLQMVFDSGSKFEEVTMAVNNGLCDGCDNVANKDRCETRCPFNSDASPPEFEARSDAKGPEPECVTTGTMSDGTILAFVGLERTGGIVTYDVSSPAQAQFHDFLNVRNWLTDEPGAVPGEDDDDWAAYMQDKMLNDGPESLAFISAEDSPLGTELLLAVAPKAGRMTVYTIEKASGYRGNDGSCKNTATCPYLSVASGGTAAARGRTAASVCATPATCSKFAATMADGPAPGSKKKSSGSDGGLMVGIIVVALFAAAFCIATVIFMRKAADAELKYTMMAEKNILQAESEGTELTLPKQQI